MELMIILIFAGGYTLIALEHVVRVNKGATALLIAALCWAAFMMFSADHVTINSELTEHLGEIAGILFFLMGAMTIVELVDAHNGFEVITSRIRTEDIAKLVWLLSFLTFFLSALLDNLTTTIVMISLLRKLMRPSRQRMLMAGLIVIAANAGGAWSPIGDVTTTMLWIGGQISTLNIMEKLFIPSLTCLLIPLLILTPRMRSLELKVELFDDTGTSASRSERRLIFFLGTGLLIMVPVFKAITHLPPYMGMLLALSILWAVTEFIHSKKDEDHRRHFTVARALEKIDTQSILFFLGILLAVASLETAHILSDLANWLNTYIGNITIIVMAIGVLSAIIDNVPLVAGAMGMYDLHVYPMDSYFWEFLAYCAGTGGSLLIIGSAAGVAAMGMEKINFFWYVRNVGWLALCGFLGGAGIYIVQEMIFHI